MVSIIIHLMNVLMIILLGLYVIDGFMSLTARSPENRDRIVRRQRAFFYMLHLCANASLYVVTQDIKYLALYGLQLILFILLMSIYNLFYEKSSKLIMNNMCLLLMIGFFMQERLNFDKSIKQFVFFAISIVFCILIPVIIRKVKALHKLSWFYAGLGIILLAIVFVIATVSYGAKLSISIGPISVQPSEFVKISYVFFLAAMLYKDKSFKNVAITTVLAAIHVLILVASKDLGAAVIFYVAYMMITFVATKDVRYLLIIIAGGVIAAIGAYFLFSHVQVRVIAWKDPFSVIDGAGYQVTQSLFAIGTGGWFGLGLFQGLPNSIPVVEEDFIFSAIAEEMGVIFAIEVLMVCVCCFLVFLNIAMQIKNQFYKLVALGLGVVYGFQVFLTIGGATKFIPSTGVTLPLISYGGSSLLSTIMIFSIIQGLYILREDEGEAIEQKRRTQKKKKH